MLLDLIPSFTPIVSWTLAGIPLRQAEWGSEDLGIWGSGQPPYGWAFEYQKGEVTQTLLGSSTFRLRIFMNTICAVDIINLSHRWGGMKGLPHNFRLKDLVSSQGLFRSDPNKTWLPKNQRMASICSLSPWVELPPLFLLLSISCWWANGSVSQAALQPLCHDQRIINRVLCHQSLHPLWPTLPLWALQHLWVLDSQGQQEDCEDRGPLMDQPCSLTAISHWIVPQSPP